MRDGGRCKRLSAGFVLDQGKFVAASVRCVEGYWLGGDEVCG